MDFATNYVNALAQGGRDVQAAQHRNALLEMQQQGQAFNQGIAQQRLGMDQERLQLARDAVTRELANIEATQGAAAAEAERQRNYEMGVAWQTARQAGDMAGLTTVARELGIPVEQLSPEMIDHYDEIIRGTLPVLQGAQSVKPDVYKPQSALGKRQADINAGVLPEDTPLQDPADAYGRYVAEEQASGRQPMSRIEFQRAGNLRQNIEVGADGGVRITEGYGEQALPKTTEGEKSSAGYLSRMKAAEETLSGLGDDATRSITSLLVAGANFEGIMLGAQQEKILQAQRDWVRAKLRKESGAVIGEDEMAEEIRTYFPLPGEDESTVEQKRQSRLQAERQFEIMSGNAASQVEGSGSQSQDQPALGIPQLLDLYGE